MTWSARSTLTPFRAVHVAVYSEIGVNWKKKRVVLRGGGLFFPGNQNSLYSNVSHIKWRWESRVKYISGKNVLDVFVPVLSFNIVVTCTSFLFNESMKIIVRSKCVSYNLVLSISVDRDSMSRSSNVYSPSLKFCLLECGFRVPAEKARWKCCTEKRYQAVWLNRQKLWINCKTLLIISLS